MRKRIYWLLVCAMGFISLPWGAVAETLLRRGNGAEPQSLDIHAVQGVPEAHLLRDLYEGLVTEGADGSHIPGAAESWTIDTTGTVYTFYLRPNGKWSNGDGVTASDFIFALRRGMTPATASAYAFLMYPIKNGRAVTAGKEPPSKLGVRAIDDLTLEIVLEQPTPFFLGQLTHYFT